MNTPIKDENQYKFKDLYQQVDNLRADMQEGFSRIESKLDGFIGAQAQRERDQDQDIQTLKTTTAVHGNQLGMFAGGQLVVSIVGSFLAYFLGKKW